MLFFIFDEKNQGNISREKIVFINYFPLRSVQVLWIGFALELIVIIIILLALGIYDSLFECVFAGMLGVVSALITSGAYYSRVKKSIYPVVDYIPFRALTIFEKLAAPVILSIFFILSLVSVIKYAFIENAIQEVRQREVIESAEKTALGIESFVKELYSELHVYSNNPVILEMNNGRMEQLLKEIHRNKRSGDIQLYFACDTTGKGPTSIGTSGDISRLPEFQQCVNTGKPLFTSPMKSQITDDLIIICVYPVRQGGKVIGVVGGTVLMDAILEIITRDKKYSTGRYLVVDQKHRIIFSATKSIIGKVIGVDIKDDGKNLKDTGRILTSEHNSFLTYTYNAKETISYKSSIPLLNYNILFSMDKSEFDKDTTDLIIMEIVFFILFASVAFGIVWAIAQSFSRPIRNTIGIFKKLSEGDLTARSEDYLTDEFGLLIRNMKRFISKIRQVINVSSDASVNLAQSVEELSATSQSISELSQTQAASIEETSASVEEVAASIEMIAAHSKEQFELAKSTYNSMSALQGVGGEVVKSASEALQISEQTTVKASEGSELMDLTIAGMNQIDNSTRSIAEMVAIISDISDRVAMLALNASIEAARAGDQGRGFAVVAEEVSKLAEETAVTAKKITEVVNAGRNEVRSGIEYVNKTSGAFKAITDNIEMLKFFNDNMISASTSEQLVINQEISKTIDLINRNTQTSASGAEEVASSAEEISAQAESLMEQMKFFKV
jgi:methyl-accepting chemotaxis protein